MLFLLPSTTSFSIALIKSFKLLREKRKRRRHTKLLREFHFFPRMILFLPFSNVPENYEMLEIISIHFKLITLLCESWNWLYFTGFPTLLTHKLWDLAIKRFRFSSCFLFFFCTNVNRKKFSNFHDAPSSFRSFFCRLPI